MLQSKSRAAPSNQWLYASPEWIASLSQTWRLSWDFSTQLPRVIVCVLRKSSMCLYLAYYSRFSAGCIVLRVLRAPGRLYFPTCSWLQDKGSLSFWRWRVNGLGIVKRRAHSGCELCWRELDCFGNQEKLGIWYKSLIYPVLPENLTAS